VICDFGVLEKFVEIAGSVIAGYMRGRRLVGELTQEYSKLAWVVVAHHRYLAREVALEGGLVRMAAAGSSCHFDSFAAVAVVVVVVVAVAVAVAAVTVVAAAVAVVEGQDWEGCVVDHHLKIPFE
jgi:hypothetical protein